MSDLSDTIERDRLHAGEGKREEFSKNLGGINLNSALLDLQIKRDGNGIPLPVIQQPIGNMKIEGFIPVIINVTPVNLPLLLGASASQETPKTNTRGKFSLLSS